MAVSPSFTMFDLHQGKRGLKSIEAEKNIRRFC
jgi:hypothetical protein